MEQPLPDPDAERRRAEAAEAEVARLRALLAQSKGNGTPVPPGEEAPPADAALVPIDDLPPLVPPDPPHIRLLKRLPTYAFILFLGWVAADQILPGDRIMVENAGPDELLEVKLNALGEQERSIERIGPGETVSIYFRVRGDGDLKVTYRNAEGQVIELESTGHHFSGLRSTTLLRIRGEQLEPTPLN